MVILRLLVSGVVDGGKLTGLWMNDVFGSVDVVFGCWHCLQCFDAVDWAS